MSFSRSAHSSAFNVWRCTRATSTNDYFRLSQISGIYLSVMLERTAERDPASARRATGWFALRPHSRGVYANFLSDEDQSELEGAYGGRLERLEDLKGRWDPENVFHLNANISPRGKPDH